jgi:hypothetical protein
VGYEAEGVPRVQYSHCNRFWKKQDNLIYQHLSFLIDYEKEYDNVKREK